MMSSTKIIFNDPQCSELYWDAKIKQNIAWLKN